MLLISRQMAVGGVKLKFDKVLVNVLFRGRELAHIDEGRKVMNEVLAALEDVAKVEKNPSMEGKRMTAIIAPRA